jgi:hypothetical protein
MNKELLQEQWLAQLPMIAAMVLTTSADSLKPSEAAEIAMELIQASADVVIES